MTVGDNYYDIIEEDDGTRAGNKTSSAPGKSTGKAAKKSKEKKMSQETVVTEVEYSVPDKVRKQKKQNARKASKKLEQSASGGGTSASLEYSTVLHVTSSSTQRFSMPPSMSSVEYSIITQQDGRRNGSMSDISGRQGEEHEVHQKSLLLHFPLHMLMRRPLKLTVLIQEFSPVP